MINLIITNKPIVASSGSATTSTLPPEKVETVISNATSTGLSFSVASASAAELASSSRITLTHINSLTATGSAQKVFKNIPDISFTNTNLDSSGCSFEFACTQNTITSAPTAVNEWKSYGQITITDSGQYKIWARIKYTGSDSTTIEAIQNQNITIFNT